MMGCDGLAWYLADRPDPDDPLLAGMPEWRRMVARRWDGELLAPAIIAGSETLILMLAVMDGAPSAVANDHLYVSTRWMAARWPAVADVCACIERVVGSYVSDEIRSN